MDITSLLWGANSGLLLIGLFFIKKWISDLEKKIDGKADKTTCDKTHDMLDRFAHSHATGGNAGEVVPR
jgi:archaellum biogenesis protein FlaJ (TadC family)